MFGNVEKSRQRRSRPFAVLTYYEYAPRVKRAAALPVEGCVLARLGWAGQTTNFFEHSLPLTMCGSSGACVGYRRELFNSLSSYFYLATRFHFLRFRLYFGDFF